MPKTKVRFFSKSSNYKILVKPYVIDVLNGIPQHRRGEKIEFVNHEFTTEEPSVIDFLRKHQAYGVDFVEDKTPATPPKASVPKPSEEG